MKPRLSALLIAFAAAFPAAFPAPAEPVQARRADEFVDTIGVNTHFGYTDRAYWTRFDEVAAKLGELGVRHVRDGVGDRADLAARFRGLREKFGIGVVQIVGARVPGPQPWTGKLDPAGIDAVLATIKARYLEANEAIEGPNEYDNTHGSSKPGADDADWPATLAAYTAALHAKVKADPILKDRPVIGPSMAHASDAPKVADLSASMTFGNMHPYPGGWNPARALDDYNLPKTRKMTGERVLWATETGYHNAVAKPPGGHDPCPEAAAGKYGPRLVAEYFRRGIARAYFYELLDQQAKPTDPEANFGLLRNDLSEKPIFAALKATIELMKDPGGPFDPAKLDYAVSPAAPELHHLLLQKRDGRFLPAPLARSPLLRRRQAPRPPGVSGRNYPEALRRRPRREGLLTQYARRQTTGSFRPTQDVEADAPRRFVGRGSRHDAHALTPKQPSVILNTVGSTLVNHGTTPADAPSPSLVAIPSRIVEIRRRRGPETLAK